MRTLGLIFAASAPAVAALLFVGADARRLRAAEGFLRLIGHAENLIRRSLTPKSLLFADFRDPALESSGFLARLKSAPDDPFAALGSLSESGLSAEAYEVVEEFFSGLGRFGYEKQLKDCAQKREKLCEIVSRQKNGLVKRRAAQLTPGIAAGVLLALILL
ncbi:MAG: hypothetical protein IJV00_07430 [Clostridia bacterium]|nr:hypothetical protein [Clostridia bacterium]